jgi:hypothetical protein
VKARPEVDKTIYQVFLIKKIFIFYYRPLNTLSEFVAEPAPCVINDVTMIMLACSFYIMLK